MTTTVADIMNPKLLYIEEGQRLSLARAQILKFGVTAVPVLDAAHRPVGEVSLRELAEEDGHVTASAAPVRTVLSTALLAEGARVIAEYGVHHLVVVNEHGVSVGMVSALDFVRALVGYPVQHPAAFERF
jgi:CBS-domain-containing membrane protein